MDILDLDSPVVLYVTDAYCGWCWGFSERLGQLEAANRGKVRFSAISGGLFVGPKVGSVSDYPHIPEANARISRITGAVFGQGYQALLEEGSTIMNSEHAGMALAALRAQAPERAIHWAHELQQAFYRDGLSLSEPATLASIAGANGLDVQKVLESFTNGTAWADAERDFALAKELGVTSYPTLLFLQGGEVHRLPGTGTALSVLNEELHQLLAASHA
ncbi:DsbA family protein [Isoptericola jiangsuensis]|uniref:DsbA family protein n=1 Tax=Isoptericola jiangsuensis TaxID=548579 RepID=UPI0038632AE6